MDATGKNMDETLYHSMIGALVYLTTSRLDIMYNICKCAIVQSAPKKSHLSAVKRIIRYLIKIQDLGIWFSHSSNFDLINFFRC